MRGSSFGYLVRQGIINTWINRMMSAASIGILTACMIIVGGSGLLAVNIRDIFRSIEEKNELVVFLKDEADEAAIADLGDRIETLDHISSYYFVSKADALEEQKEFMGDKGYLLNGLEDDNPLPASYRIKVDSLEHLNYVVDELKYYNGVETVSAPTDLARTLTGVEKTFLILGSIIIGILIVSSAVVISNTIRLTLYARRREIMIMKYVGATDSFIRLPFVVEGITIGVVSALLAFGVLSLIYESLGTMFSGSGISWLTGVSSSLIPFSKLWKAVLGSFLGFGIVLGAFGSGTSIRRYLRV
ncbi:MAG: permease-like cell division protein FtsX [Oscillospiraceae bacterium]|nr:permease-like cell division protein FtsX [Oscillospiraceae bacterium]